MKKMNLSIFYRVRQSRQQPSDSTAQSKNDDYLVREGYQDL